MKRVIWIVFGVALILTCLSVQGYFWFTNIRSEEVAKDRVRMLSWYLGEKIGLDKRFPPILGDDDFVQNRKDNKERIKDLMIDPATGMRFIYRVKTPSGETILHSLDNADRFILWSPEPNYGGKRLVLLNNLGIYTVRETSLDFTNQRVLRWEK